MADWVFVCETSEIDFEDQYKFDHEGRTFFIYNIEDGYYSTYGMLKH